MNKIIVNFQNCYGIRELTHEFDSANGNAFIIYAPNGVMKSSFAKVFDDISKGNVPKDIIFPQRETKYSITDENGDSLSPQSIFVMKPFQQDYSSSKITTLLINTNLKHDYEKLVEEIDTLGENVLNTLGKISGEKNKSLSELSTVFNIDEKDKYSLLEKLFSEMKLVENPNFSYINYAELFNDKVIAFLSLPETQNNLKEYISRYDDLLNKSNYFRKGIFDHTNANNVSKSLKDNGFFNANHKVILNNQAQKATEISNQKELDELIQAEKVQILSDSELLQRFDAIDRSITRNAELKNFRNFLEKNPEILPELLNYKEFQKKLWFSYGFDMASELTIFEEKLNSNKEKIKEIISKAKDEVTEWKRVVDIFHDRFSVPFSLQISNQEDVILKNEFPKIIFFYQDGTEKSEIGKDELFNVLSTGEQRALYLLNVIFEIESLVKNPDKTLLILDDIADSFDYKNKYAIIQYLCSILETNKFMMLILTHNFDFYRTIQSRLCISRKNNCLMTVKTEKKVSLIDASYLQPFNYWRSNVNKDPKILIALIPMVRNLLEYSKGNTSPEYLLLTALLHRKPNSHLYTINDLAPIFQDTLGVSITNSSQNVLKLIFDLANKFSQKENAIDLENKIVLSIAIRIAAEDLIIKKANDTNITNDISSNQTRELVNRYKAKSPTDVKTISLLEKVILMTPETIHLNSFMYEPLLDLSDFHLVTLLRDIEEELRKN